MKIDPRLFQPQGQLLKGQDRINRSPYSLVSDGLLLLRNTGPEKDNFHIRAVQLLNVTSVSDHRGDHWRHQLRTVRIVLLDQVIYAGTAGGNDIGHLLLPNQFFIFIGHKGGPLRRLPHLIKSKFLQGVHDLTGPVKIKHPGIGRSNGYDRLISLSQITFHPLHVACKCLCILGTDFKTAAAVDTVIHHDTCLLIPNRYGFHCTVADTFVAVAASGIFKINDLHSVTLLSFSFSVHISHN